MDTLPRTTDEYRVWYLESLPDGIPYGHCFCGCGAVAPVAPRTYRGRPSFAGEPTRYVAGHNKRTAETINEPNPRGLCMCGCGKPTALAPVTDASKGWMQGRPKRFLLGHHRRKTSPEYVEQDCGHDTPCWIWQRARDTGGYGHVTVGVGESKTTIKAHRLYYERHVGPVPSGKVLDHLCRVRPCVNPEHLEPVTNAVNTQRGSTARLTPARARAIRQERQHLGTSAARLADAYGVSEGAVKMVLSGKTWRE